MQHYRLQLIFCLIMLSGFKGNAYQHLNSTYTNVVFTDGANVRNAPSLKASIIGKLQSGALVKFCNEVEQKSDSINGIKSFWKAILFDDKIGYIWAPILADGYFKSYEYSYDVFLIKHQPKQNVLSIKVYRRNTLLHQQQFKSPSQVEINGSITLGKTINSNTKEVIAIAYAKPDNIGTESYLLYTWDGNVLAQTQLKLPDDALITSRYTQHFEKAIICGDLVNIRAEPDINAPIVTKCNKFTRVDLDSSQPRTISKGIHYEKWYKITWQNKSGFVLDSYIDIPVRFIRSNYAENISFLYTNGGIYVFKHSEIISYFKFDFKEDVPEDPQFSHSFYNFGHYGLKNGKEILGVCKQTYACGEWGGDYLYVWDGAKIKFMDAKGGIGDAGYSSGIELTFPADFGGEENKIIREEYEGDYMEWAPPFNTCETENRNGCLFQRKQIMIYEDDTLKEIPSPDFYLHNYLKILYPNIELLQYYFTNLNNDTLQDAIFVLGKRNDYENKTKPMIGIAFGANDTGYTNLVLNKSILNIHSHCIIDTSNKQILRIWILNNLGNEMIETDPKVVKKYEFRVNANNQVMWESIMTKEATYEEDKLIWQEETTQYFKTKKVLFEHVW